MSSSRRDFLKYSGALAALSQAPVLHAEPVVAAAAVNAAPGAVKSTGSLSELVNVLQGTNSNPQFSRGNTMPIAAAPFGMAHWALESRSGPPSPWWFNPADQRLQGFRCTHQLSPWLYDYGWSTILPVTETPDVSAGGRASSYVTTSLKTHPYGFFVELTRYGIHAQLAPTCRGAAMQFHSAYGDPISVVVDAPEKGASFEWDAAKGTLPVTASTSTRAS